MLDIFERDSHYTMNGMKLALFRIPQQSVKMV